jgi:hypothetical protein
MAPAWDPADRVAWIADDAHVNSRHRVIRLPAAIVALVAGLTIWPAAGHAATKIEALGESLTVKPKQGQDAKTVAFPVLNAGNGPVSVTAHWEASNAPTVKATQERPVTITPGHARRLGVTLTGLSKLKKDADGQLLLRGAAEPATKSVSITANPKPKHDWPKRITGLAALAFALLLAWVVWRAWRKDVGGMLLKSAPGPKWSFSDSWASTLTTAGAVFGTVLASVTLPDTPRPVDKDTLIELNVFFAGVVVAAPFLFQTIRKPGGKVTSDDPGLWGFNWSLLLACAVTFGAVIGQLASLALLAWELAEGAGWRYIAVGAAAVAALLAAWYAIGTSFDLVTTDWKKLTDEAKAGEEESQKSFAHAIGAAVAVAMKKPEERAAAIQEQEHLEEARRAVQAPKEAVLPRALAAPVRKWTVL